TYNDPTKKRGPPKGYIEAIEARLHRMEGLLGGLVKDKDPRAEIVRAELDAMAREAEMTGLKLRRSKAYEEINAMASSSSSSSSSGASSTAANGSISLPSAAVTTAPSSKPPHHPQTNGHHSSSSSMQPPQQQQQQSQRPALPPNHAPSGRPSTQHSASGYNSHVNTPSLQPAHVEGSNSQTSASSGRSQPMIQPSPISTPSSRSSPYQSSYESPRQPQSHPHQRPHHTLQHHHSQPALGSQHLYPKQPSQPSQQQHQQPSYHAQQSSSYAPSPSSYSSSSRHSTQTDGHFNYPSGSQSGSSHPQSNQSSSFRERDHHRSNSGGTSPIHYNTGYNSHHSNNNGYGGQFNGNNNNNGNGYPSSYGGKPVEKDRTMIMPSMDVMEHLFKVHFNSVHPVLPMLHPKLLADQIHRKEAPPAHLVFAILGLASRFSDNPSFRDPQPGETRPPSTIFYERAKHIMKDEYDSSQIATVQTLLLMAVQQMGFCESQRAWLHVGMAIRMAQDLGLNREPTEQDLARNKLQAELRKRTWWSIYVVERLVCAGLGRPLSVMQKYCETGFPQDEDEEPECMQRGADRCILEFVRARHTCAREPAPSPLYCPGFNSDKDLVVKIDTSPSGFAALDKSLAEWKQRLPEELQQITPQMPQFGLFLHMTYNTLIILLHRPEVAKSPVSAALCTQAAATITDITEVLMNTNKLTSTFISCIYAIFSAGVIHFMNVPSVKRTDASAGSSPTLGSTASRSTSSAKANLKRCIDALKFLSNQWVSAGRRAKVLEDLLDLKHVSLKDLEEDTFKNSPLAPSWALEQSRYKTALVAPRADQDKLRQQCRSKVMAIHSLLANDDEYKKMHRRPSHQFEDRSEDQAMDGTLDDSAMDTREPSMTSIKQEDDDGDHAMEVVREPLTRPIGLGVHSAATAHSPSAASATISASSPGSVRLDTTVTTTTTTTTTNPLVAESDPMVGMMAVKVDATPSLVVKTPLITGSSPHIGVTGVRSNLSSPLMNGLGSSGNSSGHSGQGAMLDPFSMPSSIHFPDSVSVSTPTITTTAATTTHANGLVNGASRSPLVEAQAGRRTSSVSVGNKFPQIGVYGTETSAGTAEVELDANGNSSSSHLREEQDLVWNDMPPTLGLDEWTAYIGAMMMRWLASGQSSPRSTVSS
ncbi:hypothetical protein BGW38_006531, partial [Lunasporangiospora selenospora]